MVNHFRVMTRRLKINISSFLLLVCISRAYAPYYRSRDFDIYEASSEICRPVMKHIDLEYLYFVADIEFLWLANHPDLRNDVFRA
mgnify:CR=1 FL=1